MRLALKRMHRHKGRRQDRTHGLTWPLRNRLIDDRNRALLAVACDTMPRRAELLARRGTPAQLAWIQQRGE